MPKPILHPMKEKKKPCNRAGERERQREIIKCEIIISVSANGKYQSIVCAHFIFLSLNVSNSFANAHCPLSRTKHLTLRALNHLFLPFALDRVFSLSLLLLFLLLCLFVELNGGKRNNTEREKKK